MSKYNKEKLEQQIVKDNLSYEQLGKLYRCSGVNIKKIAQRLGIILPQRRKINECETFHKGTGKKTYCLECEKEISHKYRNVFCDNKCQQSYTYKKYIEDWKKGLESGLVGKYSTSTSIKRYMMEKCNNQCQKCGWKEINIYSNIIPLQLHHVDGDCFNTQEANLQLLCPNCHSLTDNFGSLNKNSNRIRT